MVWVVIVVILVVAFGPIFWLMPSRRERRIGRLRQRAYQRGMRVEMRRLPGIDVAPEDRVTAGGRPLDTSRECAAYLMPLATRLRLLPPARLLRRAEGTAAVPGWGFEPGRRPEDPRLDAMLAALTPTLEALPQDVPALEVDTHAVAGYWLEGPGTTPERVDELADRLARAAESLTDLEQRLEAESSAGGI
ncbi:MAG TPA: hypothetical protein VF210_14250 [Pseudomonadales bacterium]